MSKGPPSALAEGMHRVAICLPTSTTIGSTHQVVSGSKRMKPMSGVSVLALASLSSLLFQAPMKTKAWEATWEATWESKCADHTCEFNDEREPCYVEAFECVILP